MLCVTHARTLIKQLYYESKVVHSMLLVTGSFLETNIEKNQKS